MSYIWSGKENAIQLYKKFIKNEKDSVSPIVLVIRTMKNGGPIMKKTIAALALSAVMLTACR